jgi:hypothetical protein
VDAITAATAGRWANVMLSMKSYDHSEADEANIWSRIAAELVGYRGGR